MSRGAMYAKMGAVFLLCAIGGPAIMYAVTPAEGELFKRFNPELQKYNLENRDRRKRDYEEFVTQLKEYSKSDKPIWEAAAEAQAKARKELMAREEEEKRRDQVMRDEMRAHQAQGR